MNILKSYNNVLQNIQLHGPTYFSEIINKSAQYASSNELSQENQQYYILLIITDGIINDLDKTIDEIALASNFPLSIIIIGVGSEDFSMMKILDADDVPLISKKYNMTITRDLIQFVPFREFRGKPHALARQVLFEIPDQLLNFMSTKNIKPNMIKKQQLQKLSSMNFSSKIPNKIESSNEFLQHEKEVFIKDIMSLGYTKKIVEDIINSGVSCLNPSLAAEMIEEKKINFQPKSILKKKLDRSNTTYLRDDRKKHLCFLCQINQINIILQACGCEIVCSKCVKTIGQKCPSCGSLISHWKDMIQ